MTNIKDTLQERGSVYGDYGEGVKLRALLMGEILEAYRKHHKHDMSPFYVGFFYDTLNKLCRLAISPDHIDSWHDIQGYARLIEEQLTKERASIEPTPLSDGEAPSKIMQAAHEAGYK